MRQNILFKVLKEDDSYIASGVDFPIVVQSQSFEELTKDLEEAVSLFLENEDLGKLDISSSPSILLQFEFTPEYA